MTEKNYGLVESVEELTGFVNQLITANLPIAIDSETGYDGPDRSKVSLHPEDPDFKVVGFSFTNSTDWARYVPLAHDVGDNLDQKQCAIQLWRLVRTKLCIGHNIRFDQRALSRWFMRFISDDLGYGEEVRASNGYFDVLSDTMIEAATIAEDNCNYGLKDLSWLMFEHQQTELMELFPDLPKNRKGLLRFNVLELTAHSIKYVCEDVVWCLAIHQRYYPRCKDNFIYKLEMQLLPILNAMEDHGVKYDWMYMREVAEEATEFLDKLGVDIRAELSEMTGEQITLNLNSPPQIAAVLYGKLGMVTTRYTPKSMKTDNKKMSTDQIALTGLAKQHPVVKRIVEWKKLRKLLGTFLDKYEKEFSYAPDGMTHPSILQCFVKSGRFSVNSPPYQQSPRKYHYTLTSGEEFIFNFREVIVAPKDHYMFGFDYGQVELRVIAGESKEPNLLLAFNNDIDVHTKTASLMLGIPLDKIEEEHRNRGKTLNFALGYLMSAKSLADRLGVSREEGDKLYAKYFEVYAAVPLWMARLQEEGKRNGYMISKFGRKLPLWELQSPNPKVRATGERLCVNGPCQGGAADMMKVAMVRAHKVLAEKGLLDRVHLSMNIHDALEWNVHKSVDPEYLLRILEPAVVFPVDGWPKMTADWHMGKKWGSLIKIGLDDNGNLYAKGKEAQEESAIIDDDDEELAPIDLTAFDTIIELPPEPVPAPRLEKPVPVVSVNPVPIEPDIDATSRELIVEIMDMPDKSSYLRFLDLLQGTPGPNTVLLKTPQGDFPVALSDGTGLTPSDQPTISMVLGGATARYTPEDVDMQQLMMGMEL